MSSSSSSPSSSTKVKGWGFKKQGTVVEKIEVDQYPFEEDMVEVEITVASLCHTDYFVGINAWGNYKENTIAGHEGVGRVIKIGKQVKQLKVGDRVAIGWMRSTCSYCQRCRAGEEENCFNKDKMPKASTSLIFTGPGTFAERVVVQEKFAFLVPKNVSSIDASPALCAGITVYSPLQKFVQTSKTQNIAIVGIGGLGHLAIKFSKLLGLEVTGISRRLDKRQKALDIGAAHYIASAEEPEKLKAAHKTFDIVLYCASGGKPEDYIPLLRTKGSLVVVGVPAGSVKMEIPLFALISSGISVAGSGVGGSVVTNEMLHFYARNNIKTSAKVVPIEKINDALKHMHEDPKTMPFRYIFTTPKYSKEFDEPQQN